MLYNWWLHIGFAYPWVLPLLLIVPYLIYWQNSSRGKQTASLKVSSLQFYRPANSWKLKLRPLPFLFRYFAIASLIIGLARPQQKFTEQQTTGEGIDLVLCFDISGSMTSKDFKPTRLEASKQIATEFVEKRLGDRIGVVIFSSQSFTLCPITTDHRTVLTQISTIENGYLTEDGTAIGSGLATSVDRLKDSKAKSKVVILLTDGVDFGGVIPPDIAENLAKQYGIKVYCIGIGTNQEAEVAAPNNGGSKDANTPKFSFNDNLLKHISSETGGAYFSAINEDSLRKSYDEIDKLEKSKVEITSYNHYTEEFLPFVLFGLGCTLLELLLRLTILKKFP